MISYDISTITDASLNGRAMKWAENTDQTALQRLTPREREVLDHLRLGAGMAEIARRLNISRARVPQLIDSIRRKFAAIESAKQISTGGEVLRTPLELLPLSTRTRNGLQRAGCSTLGDAVELSDQEFLRIKNLRAVSLREIRTVEKAARRR